MIFSRKKTSKPGPEPSAATASAQVSSPPQAFSRRGPLRVLAVCGSGLGSSFLVHMSLEKAFAASGAQGVEVDHADIGSLSPTAVDVVVTARDLADTVTGALGGSSADSSVRVVVLDNIIDGDEIRRKVQKLVDELGLADDPATEGEA